MLAWKSLFTNKKSKKILQRLTCFRKCLLCKLGEIFQLGVCVPCYEELPWLSQACLRCAMPMPVKEALCGACLKKPPYYHQVLAPFYYANPVKTIIKTFKFGHSFYCAPFLRASLLQKVENHYHNKPLPQVLIPMPLHKTRLRQRGFNQAYEIAKKLASKLDIPIDTKSCIRIHNNPAQSMLDAKTRRKQKLVWKIKKEFKYQHVVIIDDVITTGTTVNSLAKALHKQGVERIDVWVCARATTL